MHEYEVCQDMDLTAAATFVDLLIGVRTVAANPETGEEWGPPYSPEIRSFIVARLGDGTPSNAYDAITRHQNKGRALVALLRSVATAIEQQTGRV